MNPGQAKITYLFHSGFAVQTARCFLIFDYYQPFGGKQKSISDGVIHPEMLKNQTNVYVFASHSHSDHFDRTIMEWADLPGVNYLLSDDIKKMKKISNRCHFLAPYTTYTNELLEVQTFGSTDQGVSFLVRIDGLTLFHAGDLNWWDWEEDTAADRDKAATDFKAEIAKITGHPIDVAFFPVDRRLAASYARGAEYFAAQLQPKLLIPMHFGTDCAATAAFATQMQDSPVRTVEITHQGQVIEFY